MKIIIIYATNSGSTHTAGRIISRVLSQRHQVEMKPAAKAEPTELQNYDLIILGSPSWNYQGKEGMPHETMQDFLERSRAPQLVGQRLAVYGCGDSSYTKFCGAVDHLERFAQAIDGRLIQPALRVDGFWFDLVKNIEILQRWSAALLKKLR